jgi:RecA-family ATPase
MKKEMPKGNEEKSLDDKGLEITKGIDLVKKFRSEPRPKVLWNDIIDGSSGLITGVAKTGKTTFAENLAISFAIGRKEFFGYEISVNPKKVLFLNLEEKIWRIGMRNSAQISVLTEQEFGLFCKNYYTKPSGFPEFLNTESDWLKLHNYIDLVSPEIIFLDSLTHMCIGEIEKSKKAQDFIQYYKKYVLSFGKTTFVVHHNTKGNDKPMTQDNIAGSRVITQEFDFALGFGNIPTSKGGCYSSMLYNKDAEKTNHQAIIYSFDQNKWIEKLDETNVFKLYKETKEVHVDGRVNTKNKENVYKFIYGQYSKGSQVTSTRDLKEEFVWTSTLSKQGLHDCINKLIDEKRIMRPEGNKGEYLPKTDDIRNSEFKN